MSIYTNIVDHVQYYNKMYHHYVAFVLKKLLCFFLQFLIIINKSIIKEMTCFVVAMYQDYAQIGRL